MLERLFDLMGLDTRASTEILAAITAFLSMAYVISVNPTLPAADGMGLGAVFVATCQTAALGVLNMDRNADYPFAKLAFV